MGLAVALKAFAAAVLGVRFRSPPSALLGGIIIGLIGSAGATARGFRDTAPTSCSDHADRSPAGACLAPWRARGVGRAMRFLFKTSYAQRHPALPDRVDASWYGLLWRACSPCPFSMSEYYVGETTWVFIYALCGIS